ncbi:hypothetical protein QBC38DRAFT_540384 [Podospora fimiseda]|uniref:FAD-binding domain-containing protein n=1 Tax=Podospora fimiseda TaxID=252190 RepID=A0AAN6YLD5_9PEZI|nr:hypothetical protein QBC38DRAFT_540384 [Podospora fimiseda]
MSSPLPILIIGAGPSGLLLSLLLSRHKIPVLLLEQSHSLNPQPRASHYTAESCIEFSRAGILPQMYSQGFFPNGVSWRRLNPPHFSRLIKINNPVSDENGFKMVCLPLHRLGQIMEDELKKEETAEIRYGTKVIDIGEVEEENPYVVLEDGERVKGRYVIGCDGAGSRIRKRLFGEDYFSGYTWDKQIVATNVYYGGFEGVAYDDSQFFVDGEHWHMVAKIQEDGLYRVTYGDIGGLSYEDLKKRQPEKFRIMLPGHPTPDKYRLVNFSPYKVHQRCVDKMRKGKFLLAADAAHLCNPFGGMGLTGGIADVGGLYECLLGIHAGLADDSILDKWDEVRRDIWHKVINPISTDNLKRLYQYSGPDEAMEKDPFFIMMKKAEEKEKEMNGTGKKEEQDNPGLPPLRYDMTQHYAK